jgi:hypothetical protein
MQLADAKKVNFVLKSLLTMSSLTMIGCAPTTPNFDKDFGRALQEAKDLQKIPASSSDVETRPNSVEFNKAIGSYLGGDASKPSNPATQ